MRVTQRMMINTALDGMQTNLRRLSDLQRQAVTTKRVSKPHDDPFAVEQSLGFRSRIQANETAQNNMAQSQNWLYATETALDDTVGLLTRTQGLVLQGANDTNSEEERQSIAIEVNQVLEEMLAISNTRHGDDYLFSGFNIDKAPFAATRDANGQITGIAVNPAITATGSNISGAIIREVEPGTDMSINVPGSSAFTDIFNTLITVRDGLNAVPYDPTVVSNAITDVKTRMDNTLDIQAAVGTKLRRLESSAQRLQTPKWA
jgi:flagellar hook-associated protein 3 FlgL